MIVLLVLGTLRSSSGSCNGAFVSDPSPLKRLRRSHVTFRCVHRCTALMSRPIGARIKATSAMIKLRTASLDLNFLRPMQHAERVT